MKRIEVAIALFLHRDNDNEITLWGQERKSTDLLNGTWEFPGGKIQSGETPVSAVQREVLEEINLNEKQQLVVLSTKYNLFSIEEHTYVDQSLQVVLHIFLAKTAKEMLPIAGWQKLENYFNGKLIVPAANNKFLALLNNYLAKNPLFWSMDWDL